MRAAAVLAPPPAFRTTAGAVDLLVRTGGARTIRTETGGMNTNRQTHFYELHSCVRANPVGYNALPDGVESTCDLTIWMNDGTSASTHD